jgi:hypothetical protein
MINTNILQEKHFQFYTKDKKPVNNLLLNLNDVLNGFASISTVNPDDFINQTFSAALMSSLDENQEYFMHSEEITSFLDEEKTYVPSKIINYNGLCQLHYYLTIISFYGSLCYTLASLLDRIFKLKVIEKNLF